VNNPSQWLNGAIDGLKLLAVVVVFDAVLNMAKSFCNCRYSIGIGVFSASILLLHNSFLIQFGILLFVALLSGRFKRNTLSTTQTVIQKTKVSWPPLIIFSIVFAMSIVLSQSDSYAGLFASFYQNGSLVFGGGHVVLPLLEKNIGVSLSEQQFIFGYAAAQGIPGPMFTIATFMGANMLTTEPFYGAILATIGIFLPGFLLVLGLRQCWQSLLEKPHFYGASWGINAAVVGFLIVAFYQPIFSSAVNSYLDFIAVLMGCIFFRVFKITIIPMLSGFLLFGIILEAI
jgi:chromate transporter